MPFDLLSFSAMTRPRISISSPSILITEDWALWTTIFLCLYLSGTVSRPKKFIKSTLPVVTICGIPFLPAASSLSFPADAIPPPCGEVGLRSNPGGGQTCHTLESSPHPLGLRPSCPPHQGEGWRLGTAPERAGGLSARGGAGASADPRTGRGSCSGCAARPSRPCLCGSRRRAPAPHEAPPRRPSDRTIFPFWAWT